MPSREFTIADLIEHFVGEGLDLQSIVVLVQENYPGAPADGITRYAQAFQSKLVLQTSDAGNSNNG